MKFTFLIVWLAIGCGLFLSVASPAYAHGGGLDVYGCHNNRKLGDYHCHRGQFPGESFSSQKEMLQRVNQGEQGPKNAQPQQRFIESEKSTGGTTPTGKTIYEGPRGGHYHYSASGKKVYERRR